MLVDLVWPVQNPQVHLPILLLLVEALKMHPIAHPILHL